MHEEIGWNYRITSMQAALGIAQIDRLKENIHKKEVSGKDTQII